MYFTNGCRLGIKSYRNFTRVLDINFYVEPFRIFLILTYTSQERANIVSWVFFSRDQQHSQIRRKLLSDVRQNDDLQELRFKNETS